MPTRRRVAAKKTPSSPPTGFNTTQVLYSLLIVCVFLLGYLLARVQLQEKGVAAGTGSGAPAAGGTAPKTVVREDLKAWAKDIRLNTNNFNKCFDENQHKDAVSKDQTDGTTAGVTGTPTFYINGVQLVGAQPFQAFKDIIDKEIAGTGTGTKVTVDKGHLPALGKENAPVTIVEFSDFQCPFCKRFVDDAYPQLKKEYIDTGKAVLYFRHFPLTNIHPLAEAMAVATECANDQGKFWDMHDKIFASQ